MSDADDQSPQSLFATGSKRGRPRGRIGNRAKLGQRFFEDLYAAWEEQGESVIARAFFHDPVASLRVVATLMPQKLEITTPVDGMTDERLAQMLELADRMAALRAGSDAVMQPARLTSMRDDIVSLEYPDSAVCLEGVGGRPDAVVLAGEKVPSTLRDAPEPNRFSPGAAGGPETPQQHNNLFTPLAAPESLNAEEDIDVDPASLF